MRAEFVAAMSSAMEADERLLFLTGDLGFRALEPIRDRFGKRFINVGVAEQNLVSVAAGLAAQQFRPWVYSIAPFAVFRPYEQIRVDVCLHRLPVKIVGNGGGFAYGVNGSTHHALEDVGAMRLLPGMRIYVPTFAADVASSVERMRSEPGPGYLRLGLAVPNDRPLGLAPFRRVVQGSQMTVVALGPLLGEVLKLASAGFAGALDVWSLSAWPWPELPNDLVESIASTGRLLVLEEHYVAGGMGEAIAASVLGRVARPIAFAAAGAVGYPSSRYGSQEWHRVENGLAGEGLETRIRELMVRAI